MLVGIGAACSFALTLLVLAYLHAFDHRGAAWQHIDVALVAGMGFLVGALVVALAQERRHLRTRTAALQQEIMQQERAHGVVVARTNDLEQQVAARTATLQEQATRMLKLYHMAYDFVGNVSHEFRTPLTVIKEYVAALEEAVADVDLDPETRRFFTIIHDRVDELCLMVDDLIDVTRIEADIGMKDLLWRHQADGSLYVWFMNGLTVSGGSFLTPSAFADPQWAMRAAADFDGDGKSDLLWHHQGTGSLYVWFLGGTNGVVTQSGSLLSPSAIADTRWRIVQGADFNADGKNDILWHHEGSGSLYVWFLGGAYGVVTQTGGYLTPAAFTDTSWKVAPR